MHPNLSVAVPYRTGQTEDAEQVDVAFDRRGDAVLKLNAALSELPRWTAAGGETWPVAGTAASGQLGGSVR